MHAHSPTSRLAYPHLKAVKAQKFVDWAISAAGQSTIAAYRIGGERVFFPNAVK